MKKVINPKHNYKKTIDEFITTHNAEIEKICKKSVTNTNFKALDLYAELYLYLIDNESKIKDLRVLEGKEDKPLMRFIGQWCYNNIRVYKANAQPSNFKSKYQIKDIQTSKVKETNPDSNFTYIKVNEAEIEELIDFKEIELEQEKKDLKVDRFNTIISEMDEINRKLFNSFFVDGLNIKQVGNKYGISHYSANKLIKAMTKELEPLRNI